MFTNISCFVLAMTLVPVFEALGKTLKNFKQKNVKVEKKVCGLCTDVKVKLIKTRQTTVVDVHSCLRVKRELQRTFFSPACFQEQ